MKIKENSVLAGDRGPDDTGVTGEPLLMVHLLWERVTFKLRCHKATRSPDPGTAYVNPNSALTGQSQASIPQSKTLTLEFLLMENPSATRRLLFFHDKIANEISMPQDYLPPPLFLIRQTQAHTSTHIQDAIKALFPHIPLAPPPPQENGRERHVKNPHFRTINK